MDIQSIDYEDKLQDPSGIYTCPEDVLKDSSLTTGQKRKILNQWKYDAILIQNGESENMGGGERSYLDQVLKCLQKLVDAWSV